MLSLVRTVRELLEVLPAGSKKFIYSIAIGLSALALLDIAALGLFAMTLAPLLSGQPFRIPVVGITLEEPGDFGVMILIVCGLIILKDVLGIVIHRMSTRRFSRFEQNLGAMLLDSFFYAPWTERLKHNSTDLVRSTDIGVSSTVSGVLIPFTQLMGEVATFASVLGVLLIAQPAMATVTLIYFALVGAFLYRYVVSRAVLAGRDNRNYSTIAVRLVSEMVHSLKEITLRDKVQEVENIVLAQRKRASLARANQVFLSSVPRYILEIGLIGGLALAAIMGYWQGGMTGAFSTLALFGIAGFRVVPSLTRFQAIMSQTSANLPFAEKVLVDIEIGAEHRRNHQEESAGIVLPDSIEQLRLEDVTFSYPGSEVPAVKDVSFTLPFGSTLALVGASGSGKSTLVDIMLGLIPPDSGRLMIDDVQMPDAILSWRTRVGYVPQQVALFDSSVANNVALSWSEDGIDEDRVREALRRAQLLDVIEARPEGIWSKVGEGGLSLSGGQRQRLGIARALYLKPFILVMDEATSALDTATERLVTEAVQELSGEITVVVVAHRLATIRHSDQVCFMRDGEVLAVGTFDEVVAKEPDFAQQAKLAGLVKEAEESLTDPPIME